VLPGHGKSVSENIRSRLAGPGGVTRENSAVKGSLFSQDFEFTLEPFEVLFQMVWIFFCHNDQVFQSHNGLIGLPRRPGRAFSLLLIVRAQCNTWESQAHFWVDPQEIRENFVSVKQLFSLERKNPAKLALEARKPSTLKLYATWQTRDVGEWEIVSMRKSKEALASSLARLHKTAELVRLSRALLNHTAVESKRMWYSESLNLRVNLTLKCTICGQPVALETAHTDANGKALHEECYVAEVICWLLLVHGSRVQLTRPVVK
jgi:hypothetical protein